MSWAHILIGTAVLLFGRRLFWLFVAGTGFALGAILATRVFGHETEWVGLAIAGAAGIAGALLALFAQKVAIGIAGLLSGGYLGLVIATAAKSTLAPWIPAVIGGVLGAILLGILFDWALVAISSLFGAVLVTVGAAPALNLSPPAPALLVLVLLCLGLALQSRQLRRKKKAPPEKAAPR